MRDVELDIDGQHLRVTSTEKVFFEKAAVSKLDLVRFYEAIAQPFLLANRNRPALLQRFPNGASASSFFQKRIPDNAPEWLTSTTVSTPNGTESRALVLADIAHVAWAVNIGCLGFHTWPFRGDDDTAVDELRIDLDPSPGVVFDQVREAAGETKALFDELGIASHVKTSGNKGLHIYVFLEPRWDSYAVRSCAVAVGRELQRRHPDLITAEWWKEDRGSRVFVDYNQNAPHKTVFGTWCVRARPGAQVSTPFFWDELPSISIDELTVHTVPERLKSRGNPWADSAPQSLETLLAMHDQDMKNGLKDAPWPPVYPKQPNEPPRVAKSRAKKA